MSLQDEAWRLVRRHWRSAQELARELYRMITNEKAVDDFSGDSSSVAIQHYLDADYNLTNTKTLIAQITVPSKCLVCVTWNYNFIFSANGVADGVDLELFIDGVSVAASTAETLGIAVSQSFGGALSHIFVATGGSHNIKAVYTNSGAWDATITGPIPSGAPTNEILAFSIPGKTILSTHES